MMVEENSFNDIMLTAGLEDGGKKVGSNNLGDRRRNE